MPKEYPRSRRVAEQIQRVLAEAIRTGVGDPRVAGVVITEVRVTRDLASAQVFFTRLDGSAADPAVAAGLNSAAGFLRSRLAGVLATRTVPELRFRRDETIEYGQRLDALIDAAIGHGSTEGPGIEGEAEGEGKAEGGP
jgi:ribosome-binding factor A